MEAYSIELEGAVALGGGFGAEQETSNEAMSRHAPNRRRRLSVRLEGILPTLVSKEFPATGK